MFIFALLIIFLPSQFSLHTWPTWSFVHGLPIDYLSPTLYVTDLLILLLLITQKFSFRLPLLLITVSVFNTAVSISPINTLLAWVRVYEYYWLFKCLTNNSLTTASVVKYLPISLIWTSILAFWQTVIQHSVGGMWYFLGERTFQPFTPNIATIELFGQRVLRAYATFPHPNALAGFAVVSFWLTKSHKLRLLSLITLTLAYSRAAAIALTMTLLVTYAPKKIAALGISVVLLLALITTNYADKSISIRNSLNMFGVSITFSRPLTGTGLNTNILAQPSTSSILQPIHNIYILLTSELGIPTVLLASIILLKKIKLSPAILAVALTGLFDHYWITLHQNQLLLTLLLASQAVQSKNNESVHNKL